MTLDRSKHQRHVRNLERIVNRGCREYVCNNMHGAEYEVAPKIRNRFGNVPRGFVVVRVTNSIVTLIYEY